MRPANLRIPILYGLGVIAVLLPLAAASWLARHHSLKQEEERAGRIAADLLRRTDRVSEQLGYAIGELNSSHANGACSDQNVLVMRALVIRENLLVDVGYVSGNVLLCSAFGRDPVAVGPPTYISGNGYPVRVGLRHPLAPDTSLIVVSDPHTGFAGIVSQDLLIDMVPDEANLAAGMISLHGGIVLAQHGAFDPRWRRTIGKSNDITFYDGTDVVAWKSSQRTDYAAFAAISRHRIEQDQREILLILMPIGLAAAALLFFVVLRLARLQTSTLSLLRAALRTGREFSLVYQPVVDLRTGQWCGAEALLRWRRLNGEVIGPDVFIPIAESNQLMEQITDTVLHLLEEEAGELLRARPQFYIAVNLSADDFCHPSIVQRLCTTIGRMGIAPHNLQVEATERVFLDIEASRRNLQRLRAAGIKLAIDDFGSGYSSLAYLHSLEADSLKIDKTFVETIGKQVVTSEVIRHIIEMAKALKLVMVAEGVESEAQAQFLRAQGVQYGQGWLFARPMSIRQLSGECALRESVISAPRAPYRTSDNSTADV
jgi:sensor c-di-GMP phosphodiesterase-like protein